METIPQETVIHGGMSSFRPAHGGGSSSSSSGSWLSGHCYQRSTDSSGSGASSGPLSKFRFQPGRKGSGGGGERRGEPPYQTVLANLSGRPRTSPGQDGHHHHHHHKAMMAETNLDDPVGGGGSSSGGSVDSNGNREKRTVNFNLTSTAFPGAYNNNDSQGGGGGGSSGGAERAGSLKRRTLEYTQRPSSGYSSGSDSRLYKDPRPDPPLVVYDTSPSERHQHMEMASLRAAQPAHTSSHRPHSATTTAGGGPPSGAGGGQGGAGSGRRGWGRDSTDGLSDDSTTTSGSYVLNVEDHGGLQQHREQGANNKDSRQSKHFVV